VGYQPEQPSQQQYVEPPQQLQYGQHPQQHAEAGMEDEDGGFPGGPYDLSLLLDFSKHVTFKLWNDKTISIIALFNLMIFYYYVKFILRRICHVYFTYVSIIDLFLTYLSIIDLFLT